MKRVMIKNTEKAIEYGFTKRHIIDSDDEFDLYELQINNRDALYFYEESAEYRYMDGELRHYANIPTKTIATLYAELALLGIVEVKDE